jgi:hypothetical protein
MKKSTFRMTFRVACTLSGLALVAPGLPFLAAWAYGCAVAFHPGRDVDIAEETAFIVFDSASRTEHFIRKAEFVTDAEDFGFLVPTPSVPTLHETGERLFSFAESLTEPRIEYVVQEENRYRLFKPGTGLDIFFSILPSAQLDSTAAPNSAVQVISETQVAGYDAAILKADDAAALRTWLDDNGYAVRPALESWLEFYTEKGWYLTAFKFARPTASEAIGADEGAVDDSSDSLNKPPMIARPVRITFTTDKPFYPYHEPADMRSSADQPASSRLLRLYVLSDVRMEATVGEGGIQPASTAWANRLQSYQVDNLRRYMMVDRHSGDAITFDPDTMYLTEFEDRSSPRPGTDELYLTLAADQSSIERPPVRVPTKRFVYSPDLHKWPFWLLGLSIPVSILVYRIVRRPAR